MENKLEIFKNEEFGEIRTFEEEGKIMFCGSDIAKALGYNDTAKAIKQYCREDILSQRQFRKKTTNQVTLTREIYID